jgi:hypothetical protein
MHPDFAASFESVFAAGRCAFPSPLQWFSVQDLQNGQWFSGAVQKDWLADVFQKLLALR